VHWLSDWKDLAMAVFFVKKGFVVASDPAYRAREFLVPELFKKKTFENNDFTLRR
jgi:hypothetical protein